MGGEACFPPPVWLMRQAGRYLPEYQAIRAKAPSFLDFCYTPALAAEATLQPVRRFGFDAAILFSDILVVPDALGQKVHFEPNEGPKLNPIVTRQDFAKLTEKIDRNRLSPVFETIERVKQSQHAGRGCPDRLLRCPLDACLLYDRRQKLRSLWNALAVSGRCDGPTVHQIDNKHPCQDNGGDNCRNHETLRVSPSPLST